MFISARRAHWPSSVRPSIGKRVPPRTACPAGSDRALSCSGRAMHGTGAFVPRVSSRNELCCTITGGPVFRRHVKPGTESGQNDGMTIWGIYVRWLARRCPIKVEVAISVIQDSAKGHDRLCGISDIHSKRSWNCDRLATAIRRGNGRGGGQFTLVSNGRAIDGPQFLLPCGIDRCVRETLITCAAGRGAGIKKDVLGGGCCGNLFSDLNSLSRSIADGKQHFLDGALTFAALRVPRRHGRVSR